MRSEALQRAPAALTALLVLSACGGEPAAPPPPPDLPPELARCGRYTAMPDAFGYCLTRGAERLPSVEALEAVCPLAGDLEAECRRVWVSGRRSVESGFSTAQLLAACGPFPDCAFELLDFRPASDPFEQIDACRRYAGPYHADCVVHAMERWWRARPDAEALAAVSARRTDYPSQVGAWVGTAVACQGVGRCGGDPAAAEACEAAVARFSADPGSCPPLDGPPPR